MTAPDKILAFEDGEGGIPRAGYWFDEQSEAAEGSLQYTRTGLIQLAAENAALRAELDQLEQDLSNMRDNIESAYRRGYWAGGNGA